MPELTILDGDQAFGLYSLSEARDELADASADPRYATSRIQLAHDACKELFEDYCGVLFIAATETLTVEADGSAELYLPCRLVTAVANVTVDELAGDGPVDYEGAVLAVEDSWIVGDTAFAKGARVTLDVTHGHTTVPSRIKLAALTYLKDQILGGSGRVQDTALPARTKAYAVDGLQVELGWVSRDDPTGNPDVDRALRRERRKLQDAIGA